jgi:hypothetical protein
MQAGSTPKTMERERGKEGNARMPMFNVEVLSPQYLSNAILAVQKSFFWFGPLHKHVLCKESCHPSFTMKASPKTVCLKIQWLQFAIEIN